MCMVHSQKLPEYALFGGKLQENCGIVQKGRCFFVQTVALLVLYPRGQLCYNMYEGMRF